MRERRFLCSLAPSEESPDTFNEKLAMRDTQWKPHTIHQVFSNANENWRWWVQRYKSPAVPGKNTLQLGSMVNGVALTIHIHECCCSIETMKQGCLRCLLLLATTSSLFLQPALSNHLKLKSQKFLWLVQETSCIHSQREQGPLWTMFDSEIPF